MEIHHLFIQDLKTGVMTQAKRPSVPVTKPLKNLYQINLEQNVNKNIGLRKKHIPVQLLKEIIPIERRIHTLKENPTEAHSIQHKLI